jgi:hypothetical protein
VKVVSRRNSYCTALTATVLVTVWVPAVEVAGLMAPVVALI